MKPKIIILMCSGLLAGSLAVSGQDNPPAADAATANAAAVTNAAPLTDASGTAVAATETVSAEAPPAADTVTIATNSPIIPLIVMDDVPLTDAIKNLARQANINYMLDPRIAFGQPGADGKITPQPSVSIRWENISAQQALNALLGNYGLQLVEDPKTLISRVTIKDPAAPDPLLTRIIQLKYSGPSNLLAAAQTALTDRRSKIMGDVRTSQLVVLATERELDALDEMVARLDLPTKQVLIEAKLVETSMNPKTIKGVDWSSTLQGQTVRLGNNLQENVDLESVNRTLSETLPRILIDTAKGFNPATAFLDADGVSAVFSFINQNAESKVISAPRTVTLDNETANISVTRLIPILTSSPSSANTPGSTSITYSNVGVILNVTPRISANNTVNLKVAPEVSRVFSRDNVLSGGFNNTVFTFDARTLTTAVVIPSGNTLVLGGLVSDDVTSGNTKVPFLGDIPFLGRAFRSDRKERAQNNLIIFITPTIVEDSDFQPTQTTFLKTKPTEVDNNEWSAWDSGKPYDWSKVTGRDYKF